MLLSRATCDVGFDGAARTDGCRPWITCGEKRGRRGEHDQTAVDGGAPCSRVEPQKASRPCMCVILIVQEGEVARAPRAARGTRERLSHGVRRPVCGPEPRMCDV